MREWYSFADNKSVRQGLQVLNILLVLQKYVNNNVFFYGNKLDILWNTEKSPGSSYLTCMTQNNEEVLKWRV